MAFPESALLLSGESTESLTIFSALFFNPIHFNLKAKIEKPSVNMNYRHQKRRREKPVRFFCFGLFVCLFVSLR